MKHSDPRRSEFLKISSAKYHSMAARLTEKRDKNNRILRIGRPLKFTLREFREWIEKHLGPDGQGVCRCVYCGKPISLQTMVPDHVHPLSLGGDATLENLTLCCDPCNATKGNLSLEDFNILLKALSSMSSKGSNSVSGRLQKSEKLASMVRRNIAKTTHKYEVQNANW